MSKTKIRRANLLGRTIVGVCLGFLEGQAMIYSLQHLWPLWVTILIPVSVTLGFMIGLAFIHFDEEW